MNEQPENKNAQNTSPDDFFKGHEPQQSTPTFSGEDIVDQLKQNIGSPNGLAMIAQVIIPMLPLPYRYKRNITNKLHSGQPITIWDILLGGISVGRVVRSVIGIIVFLIIAYVLSSRGIG